MRIFAPTRNIAVVVTITAAALPRLVVLAVERQSILTAYTEKSDDFARTFVDSGTFGFVAGHPSASTQPLYSFFLIPIYAVFGRHWLAVGIGQIALAAVTAVLVYFIGRIVAPRFALLGAVVTTLNPYLIWHDVHINREITDQVVLAAIVLVTLTVARRTTAAGAVLLGVLAGVAILGNTRLALLPIVLAGLLLARSRSVVASILVVAAAAVVVTPWLVRNDVQVGCFALTTDARALWKANNAKTYETLAHGKWIDDVPQPSSFPPTPEDAAAIFHSTGRYPPVDECAQMSYFEHLATRYIEHHPRSKAKLAAQSAKLLWDPRVHETQGRPGKGTWRDEARRVVEPVWAIPVFVAAAAGLVLAADRLFVAVAVLLCAYNTLAAMVFAGTTRYRVPFDFLLVLLAIAAIDRYTRSTPAAAPSSLNDSSARRRAAAP